MLNDPLVIRLLVWVSVFLSVFLTVVYTSVARGKENRLLHKFITGSDEVELKREKRSKADILLSLENLARGAGLNIGGVEVFLIILFSGGAGFAMLMALFSNETVAFVAVPVGMYVPVLYLKERAKKRGFGMVLQLAEALTHMANLLRNGAQLNQALISVTDRVPDPLGKAFRRIRNAVQRNRSAVASMEEVIPDVPLSAYKTICVVAAIHSQLGGDMATSFDDISTTLKDMHALQENLNTQTTAMRLAGVIVGVTPFVVVAFLQALSGGTYYNDFLKTFFGKFIVISCIVAILFGWWRIFRMSQFRME